MSYLANRKKCDKCYKASATQATEITNEMYCFYYVPETLNYLISS